MRKNPGEHGWNFFHKFVIRVAIKSHYLAVNKVFREPTAAQLKLLHGVCLRSNVVLKSKVKWCSLDWSGIGILLILFSFFGILFCISCSVVYEDSCIRYLWSLLCVLVEAWKKESTWQLHAQNQPLQNDSKCNTLPFLYCPKHFRQRKLRWLVCEKTRLYILLNWYQISVESQVSFLHTIICIFLSPHISCCYDFVKFFSRKPRCFK